MSPMSVMGATMSGSQSGLMSRRTSSNSESQSGSGAPPQPTWRMVWLMSGLRRTLHQTNGDEGVHHLDQRGLDVSSDVGRGRGADQRRGLSRAGALADGRGAVEGDLVGGGVAELGPVYRVAANDFCAHDVRSLWERGG